MSGGSRGDGFVVRVREGIWRTRTLPLPPARGALPDGGLAVAADAVLADCLADDEKADRCCVEFRQLITGRFGRGE